MKVIRAKKMGFCFGVREAVELSKSLCEKYPDNNIYMIGMLVHNKSVVDELSQKGIKILTEDEVIKCNGNNFSSSDIVIVRAHGTIKKLYDILKQKKVKIYDGACIFVKRAREKMVELSQKGYKTIFIGDEFHPEVKGIISFTSDVIVCKNLVEVKKLKLKKDEKYSILAQTTLNKNEFSKIKSYFEANYDKIIINNTICGATQTRQKAIEELVLLVDVVVVIGGKNSSNTKKLYDISKRLNENSYLIEDYRELDMKWLENVECVGITAGASTPENIIKKVEMTIKGEND